MGLYSGELSSNDLWWEVCQLIFLGHVDTIPPQYPGTKTATGQVHKILFSWSLLSLLFSSLVRWNCDNLPYCDFLFFFLFVPNNNTESKCWGKKNMNTNPPSPHNHENEKLPYFFHVKSKLEMPAARNLCIGVDTTVKYMTNKISDFLSLLPSFHNLLAFFHQKMHQP